MSRCDHCTYRNGWECGDGWRKCGSRVLCEDFDLDFDTLSDKQKQAIQRTLMRED